MKRYLILLTLLFVFILLTVSSNETNAQDVNQDTAQVSQQNTQAVDVDQEHDVLRLKKEKNDLMDRLAQRRLNMISLAAVLTLVSCFLVLFIFMFLRLKRRYRLDIAELEEKLNQK